MKKNRSINHVSDPLFIGIDCGTQSLRVCCVNKTGDIIARAKRDLHTYYRFPLWAEQEADEWWQALTETMNEVCRDRTIARRIVSLGICGTCSTLVPCDFEMHPTAPAILWVDNRATTEAHELRQALHHAGFLDRLSSEQMAPKLLWLARHHPGSLHGLLVESVSWLVFRLTGTLCVSNSITNFTWGILPDQWVRLGSLGDEITPALRALRVAEKPSTAYAGVLRPEAASALGIRMGGELVSVAVGGNDGLLSAVGAGLLCSTSATIEVGGTSYVLVCRVKDLSRMTSQQYAESYVNPFESDSRIMISSIETAGLFLTWLTQLL